MGLLGYSPFPDITDLFGGGGGPFSGLSLGLDNPFKSPGPGEANWIKGLLAPAYGDVRQGTADASSQLRQAYEGQFRARLGGLTSGFGEQASRLGAQTASQGLSPDVIQRMLIAPGAQLQGEAGTIAGETQYGLHSDLARFLKGTGTELAGLHTNEAAIMANYMAALKGAKAAENAGLLSGLGGLLGGIL